MPQAETIFPKPLPEFHETNKTGSMKYSRANRFRLGTFPSTPSNAILFHPNIIFLMNTKVSSVSWNVLVNHINISGRPQCTPSNEMMFKWLALHELGLQSKRSSRTEPIGRIPSSHESANWRYESAHQHESLIHVFDHSDVFRRHHDIHAVFQRIHAKREMMAQEKNGEFGPIQIFHRGPHQRWVEQTVVTISVLRTFRTRGTLRG